MKDTLQDISSNSYTPYSGNPAGCIILGKRGLIYPGVRIENASFPLTISAIQAGICSCFGNRDEPASIRITNSKDDETKYWTKVIDLEELKELPENVSFYNPRISKGDQLFSTLQKLLEMSVSDESGFPVVALLQTEKGFIPGVNIEFRDWSLGLCAERIALSRALAFGCKEFKEMHIYAPKSNYISPCGACRQVLFELMPNSQVILYHDKETKSRHIVSHLLPNSFTSNSLRK